MTARIRGWPPSTPVADLVNTWRQQATAYDRDGQPGARLLARVADELEAALATTGDALVPLNDAARLSGYSADHLGRLIRDGKLVNMGTRHRPRVRVGDLPRKPALTARRRPAIVGAQ
jgi:hypothetical protein